jgi:hypothetical protein
MKTKSLTGYPCKAFADAVGESFHTFASYSLQRGQLPSYRVI